MKKTDHFIWIFPFFSFVLGYIIFSYTFKEKPIIMPPLIGKNIFEASKILSHHTLNLRIIAEKEDADLPHGSIISQKPKAEQKIKSNQSVFVTISSQPQPKKAPLLLHKSLQEIKKICGKEIRFKSFFIPHNKFPEQQCIAQFPPHHEVLQEGKMILYFAQNSKPVLLPDFKNMNLKKVTDFLSGQNIPYKIFHAQPSEKNHECSSCRVLYQKPLAGSLIKKENPLTVQLKV